MNCNYKVNITDIQTKYKFKIFATEGAKGETGEIGTPFIVSSVSEMTDTSRLYVNTTDGKWYYYDGEEWQVGGDYQATGIADNSVTYNSLDQELKNSFSEKTNTTNIQRTIGYLLNIRGEIQYYSGNYCVYDINVVPNDTYKLHIYFPTSSYSGDYNVTYAFMNDNTLVSYKKSSDMVIINNYYDAIVDIPEGVNRLVINTPNVISSVLTNNKSYILKVNNYEVKNISKNQLDEKLQTIFNDKYEEIEISSPFIQSAYFSSGNSVVYAYNGTKIYAIPVSPNEKYRITVKQIYGNPIIAFSGENFIKTITVSNNDYDINNFIDFIQSSTSGYNFVDYEFTIPEYCSKIYVNVYDNDTTFKIEKVTSYKIGISQTVDDYNSVGFKKWYAIGDSITEVNYRALHNYLYWINQDIPDLTIVNQGISGTGYKNGNNTFIQRLDAITSYDLDTDIITVMGSINDIQHVANSLGELGDTTTDTLYGSMYQFFNTLFTKFNGVRVGCISPINWKGSGTSTQLDLYNKALKDTCNLFNVPFLDMTNNTNLRPDNTTFLNTYYEADGTGNTGQIDTGGVHPNSAGHKLLYGRIKDFIIKL